MSFKPEDIAIPWINGEEIPIGMNGIIPVELRREVDGALYVGIYCSSDKVPKEEETPEGVIKVINRQINHFQRWHPNLLAPKEVLKKPVDDER